MWSSNQISQVNKRQLLINRTGAQWLKRPKKKGVINLFGLLGGEFSSMGLDISKFHHFLQVSLPFIYLNLRPFVDMITTTHVSGIESIFIWGRPVCKSTPDVRAHTHTHPHPTHGLTKRGKTTRMFFEELTMIVNRWFYWLFLFGKIRMCINIRTRTYIHTHRDIYVDM